MGHSGKDFFRHRQMTKSRQPIVTISFVAPALSSISSFSRSLERLYPRSASSRRSLSSDVVFSEPDKSGELLVLISINLQHTLLDLGDRSVHPYKTYTWAYRVGSKGFLTY